MLTLITDRTQADIDRLKELTNKALTGVGVSFQDRLTPEEQAEWLALSNKGAYNASDLNRVGTACATLYAAFQAAGYEIPEYYPTPTDWGVEDLPYQRVMDYYIGNVAALKAAIGAETDIPDSMDGLDIYGANAIERLLAEVEDLLNRVTLGFIYSGEGNSGEL